MTESPIRDVSDTAFWIAHHRAEESDRPDALFHDPLARRLAGERGQVIGRDLPAQRFVAWNVSVRTCIIDDFIREAIAQGVDMVLNLGAGLDARPWRMELPPTLRWVEVDHPHLMAYKAEQLAGEKAHCQVERISLDLADREARRSMLAGVNARAGKMLLITEGVLPYLSVEEAAALADDLRALDRASGWIVDYISALAMEYRERGGMANRMQNAPFKFKPQDWFAFFRGHGWQCTEMRYMPVEGERLGRPFPLPLPVRMLMRLASPEKKRAVRELMGYALMGPC